MFDVVFLDMDNTIAENTTCRNVEFVDGMYENKRPISFVIDAINALLRPKSKRVVLVTIYQGGDLGMQEKLFWLEKIRFKYDDILFIEESTQTKTSQMIEYCNKYNCDPCSCLFIDDKKSMLQDAEKSGLQVMYPQQLLVSYYEFLQKQK